MMCGVKKLLLGLPVIMFLITGCACNKSIIDLNFKFDKATVCQKDGTCKTYDIRKWDDYDNDAISIWTEDGLVIYGSMDNITLYGES